MKKNRYNKIDKLLELPKEVYSDVPKIIMTGFEEVYKENFKGLGFINYHIGIISINGYQLTLENMTNDDIKVKGKIEGLDIERTIDEN